jgi:hypothetical protein
MLDLRTTGYIPFVLSLETNGVQRPRTRLERGNERGIGKGALVMLRGRVLRGAAGAQTQKEPNEEHSRSVCPGMGRL